MDVEMIGYDHTTKARPAHPVATDSFAQRGTRKADPIYFAGRVGGNQTFTTSPADSGYKALEEEPDASPISNFTDAFRLQSFLHAELWKKAIIECWVTSMLVFTSGLCSSSLAAIAPDVSPVTIPLLAALCNLVSLTLFIYAASPVSGGHLNPLITVSTFFAGLATFARTVLYMFGQSIGAVIGGFMLKAALGPDYFAAGIVPGCIVDERLISRGQMFLLEWITAQVLLFLAFGVGLDPRQASVFGPALSPFLVGLSLSTLTFATSFVRKGYYGSSLNPARCLGLLAPIHDFRDHYIIWLADLSAAGVNGLFYYFIPPYKKSPRKRQ